MPVEPLYFGGLHPEPGGDGARLHLHSTTGTVAQVVLIQGDQLDTLAQTAAAIIEARA